MYDSSHFSPVRPDMLDIAVLTNRFADRYVERNNQSPDPLLASLVVVKERAGFKKGRGHK